MPRKAEIQAEETAISSPLRRSNRKAAVNSPAPATLATRRTSQTHNEAPKTRRASLSQDNTDKDEKTDNKPTTRGRRASTTKEEPETKPEPAKTRGRRSSASTESTVEESKPQTATRRRRSSAAEDLADAETLKPIRTRRSSATEKPPEEEPAKRTTRTRRGSLKEEEPKEEPVKRAPRSRRGSVDTADSSEPKEKKPNTRGRRLSTDEPEREPETKTVKLTPVKSRRRLSVTENAVNLEPIEELESEIKSRRTNSPNTNEVVNLEPIGELKSKIKGRNSSSPISKEKVINLTPVKPAKPAEVKENLNLSIINETSIVEETQDDKDTSEGGTVTPRRSPRLSKDKQKSAEKLASPSSSPISHLIMEEKQSPKPDMKDLSKEEETAKEHVQSSPKKITFTDAGETKNLEKDMEDETFSEKIETVTPKKEQAEQNEEDKSSEDKSVEISVSKTLTEVENCNISMGSDGSFKFHLNVSISASQNESIQEKDDLNSSKSSNTSDKENISTNSFSTPKKNSAEGKEQGLDSLTNTPISEKNVIHEDIVVARVSNVFRPRMKENSFMEPMEVDEYPSILDSEQPEESDVGGVLATPTLTTKQNSKDIEIQEEPINKNVRKSLIDVDGDSVGDSFYLNLSNGAEENEEKPKDVLEDVNQDETTKIKSPENFSNSKDEHSKLVTLDVKDSSEQVDNPLKTSDEDGTSSEMKPHVLEEISRKKMETETTGKIDLEIINRNISSEKIQDLKETPLSDKLKNNDLESESLDDIKKQEVKTSQSDTNYENLEASGKERRRSKSPSFICVQTDEKKTVSRKSKSPQPTENVPRKSKSPQPTEHVPRKSKSPMLDLRRSKSPLCVKEKSSRKSKSPTSQSSPKKSKEQNVEKFIRSASPSALQDEGMSTDDVDISSVNVENVIDESSSSITQFSEKSPLQGKEITDVTLNPTVTNEKKADDVSPRSSVGHSEEGILLRKLKSPLIHAKNQTNKKISSGASIDANPLENTQKQGNITDSDVEEKMDVKSENSITYNHEENSQEGQSLHQSKYPHLKSGFSTTESPSSQNIKISDIEVEVKRRSKSPESLRRSTSPQSDSTMPEKLLLLRSEETNIESEKTENTKQIEEINKFNMQTCEDLAEKSENLSSNRNESKDLDTESKQPLGAAENTVNMPPKESIKSDTLDDYDFELPSDEEEAEKTRAPEYDQSTVVTSYIASSQLVGDVSTSTEMETVILVDRKKINDSEVYEKENSPEEKDSSSSQNSKEIELELDVQQTNEKENLDKKSGDEELLETMQIPDKKKIDDDRSSEDSNELKDEFVDEVQTHELKGQDEIANYNEEKINNSDMKSPQKKLKVRKYSLKKTMESYEEDMERSDKEKKDSEEESENRLHRSKTLKKSKKRCRVVEEDIEKDSTVSDDGLEVEVAKIKNSKSRKLSLKKGSDSDIENIAIQKKAPKSKEFVTKELQNIEDAKSNDKKSTKKKIISPKPIKQSTTEEDSDLEETTNSEEHNERSSKKKTKSVLLKMPETAKEKYTKEAKDGSKKSPASVLDKFVTKKIAEMTSDGSSSEDENPEEPNEYVCTMAEEGEEDTPSEDSNAIIDDGESVGSTESEYGSDDEYDENDSFICDDEEEPLLSGEEYDLNAEKKKKKSRIIQLDSYNDDIIKIQKKEKLKPVEKKKKTRIISITDSSESEEDEAELYKVNDSEEMIKPAEESTETQEVICVEEKTDEEVFIVETKPTATSLEQSPNVSAIESPEIQQRTEKKRLSSITIHENIDVKEIKDAPLSERISHLVDSFCTSMRKGEISMNLSIECCAKDDDSGEEIENSRRAKKRRLSRSRSTAEISNSVNSDDNVDLEENIEETSFKPPKRLSVSMNNLIEAKKRAKKRKLSQSMDNLDQIETKSKKKKTNKKKKKNVEKNAIKSPKPSTLLEDNLNIRSLGLLNQLITDIKNRPRRTVKPSTNMNNSWITEVAHVKPSTSAFDKEEKAAYKAGKVHPKDFRSQMLNDPSRVRRIETKAILKKKGVHL